MKIIDKTYKWARPLYTRSGAPLGLVHHNAAATHCTADAIHSWHIGNGWSGIAYHFFITKDGKVYRGRPENKLGGHTLGASAWLGWCCEGNFDKETMPAAQVKACQELLAYLRNKYGKNLKSVRHKDMPRNSTSCPGKNYPFSEIVNEKPKPSKIALTKQDIAIPRMHKPRAGWWNFGLVPYIESLRKQGDGKRVDTTRKDDLIIIPVPAKKPAWWKKMWKYKKDNR